MSQSARHPISDAELEAMLYLEMTPPPADVLPDLAQHIVQAVRTSNAPALRQERSHPWLAAFTAVGLGATAWLIMHLTMDALPTPAEWARWAALLSQRVSAGSSIWLPGLMWTLAGVAICIALLPEEVDV